jgi:hypothetical protein
MLVICPTSQADYFSQAIWIRVIHLTALMK